MKRPRVRVVAALLLGVAILVAVAVIVLLVRRRGGQCRGPCGSAPERMATTSACQEWVNRSRPD